MQKELNEILDERQITYGDAYDNFTMTGKLWGVMLGIDAIEPWKVALMMDAFKTVRCIANPNHVDSWDDKLGYATHGKEIVNES